MTLDAIACCQERAGDPEWRGFAYGQTCLPQTDKSERLQLPGGAPPCGRGEQIARAQLGLRQPQGSIKAGDQKGRPPCRLEEPLIVKGLRGGLGPADVLRTKEGRRKRRPVTTTGC